VANFINGLVNSRVLLLGNEAIARGALEAGVQVCAAYPGTPSTEIMQSLIDSAQHSNLYAEWSVNEKVAVEVAAAAAFSGLRSLACMKNAGANVSMDAFMHLNLSGIGNGAMVVIICDDPQAHSSGDEMDTRWIAQMADVPLLEPSNIQEAKDMTKWAFELSNHLKVYCILRSYTRLGHSRSGVRLGEIPQASKKAMFDTSKLITPYATAFGKEYPTKRHAGLHEKQAEVQEIFGLSPFNSYSGPEKPKLLIICSGSGWPCSMEAVETLNLSESVGILKLGTLWPFPKQFIQKYMVRIDEALVVEEVDPFVENHVKELASESATARGLKIYGKGSGHLNYYGEITPDLVIKALARIFNLEYQARETEYEQKAGEASSLIIERGLAWCPGCPHRATFFVLKNVTRKHGRRPIIAGDIGCYTMDQWACGTQQTNACLCMGSGMGLASGFGQLARFGLEQPVIAISGDSTFFHASIPALINAVFNKSKVCLIVLDNGATAMTGFQPHPGTGHIATGGETVQVEIESIAKACGVRFIKVMDPFDFKNAVNAIEEAIKFDGPAVVISRRKCALVSQREKAKGGEKIVPYRIDTDRCNKCVLIAEDKVMPCSVACPAGNDIPTVVNLVKQGEFNEAIGLIRKGNPLPSSLGRVCYHPCEADCNRGKFDEAIAIRTLERFLGDYGLNLPYTHKPKTKQSDKIAVVGSGPAGLTCAYNLTLMGYPTTVFEALPVPGGMLAVGIPDYRLPKDVLNAEIKKIEDLGVRIHLNTPIRSVEQLLREGYKAVFIGTGAHRDLKLDIPGEDKVGVLTAAKFLRDINLGNPVSIGDKVFVIGGGNSAIDSARVVIRKGAKQVSIIYRRSRNEMPASEEEMKAVEEEGVKIIYLATPTKILGGAKISGIECTKMRLVKPDASGRAQPILIKGSEFTMEADTVIEAIGQVPELSFAEQEFEVSPQGTLWVDPGTLATRRPGVFAGGDVVTGPSYVATAIGAGKQAATSIDRYLRGEPLKIERKNFPVVSFEELSLDCIPPLPRATTSTLPAETRVRGFAEVENGFTPVVAIEEAERCLSCNAFSERCIISLNCPAIIRDKNGKNSIVSFLCDGCGICADICPHKAIVKEEIG
jgi:indolepyruvate ferredoxin oxidoreductase alpha subunit